MKQKFIEIENELIEKQHIVIVAKSTCWGRTHAHVDGTRRICKWIQNNSVQSLFTLAHEIGHIETTKKGMRRCESEYFATKWAIDVMHSYSIEVPGSLIKRYQNYIDQELDRGLRRGGKNYIAMNLRKES